ncbi:MAG: MaoC family dehydratase [Halobacteriota archaeon]
MEIRYYEDIEPGVRHDLGHTEITAEAILRFAERYDPQPFHVDPERAVDSPYGGLIASGWHTAAICMRRVADGYLNDTDSMGAFGLDELRWRTPVRPGDSVHVSLEIVEKRPSSSRDDRGYVVNEVTGTNDEGEEVLFWRATNIIGRRPD